MSVPQIRQRFQLVSRSILLGVAVIALTIAYAAPSFSNSETTQTPRAS